ncbi:phosphodiester glycosidase family protein [Deinococcus sp. ZS9-10]|uniref:Phosphodiester glycosidase family protein n=2 Tax=Deinococcus arenicola TaxID=2994950 RepID=A0ABU4DLI3_9DEIO|nr:phosphodiester glycosidase family protein [Deinococcus sp. ZS9-10]
MLDGTEMLAVWTLPHFGVSVRNDPLDLRLVLGPRELQYTPGQGWRALGFAWTGTLPPPMTEGVSLYVPLQALRVLGLQIRADTSGLLDVAAPASIPAETLPPSEDRSLAQNTAAQNTPAQNQPTRPATSPSSPETLPVPEVRPGGAGSRTALPSTPPTSASIQPIPTLPAPAPPPLLSTPPVSAPPASTVPTPPLPGLSKGPNLDTVRVSRTQYRTVEVMRVVLELSAPASPVISRQTGGIGVVLPGFSVQGSTQNLPGGAGLTLTPTPAGASIRLTTRTGRSEVFTLDDPFRVVIDTTTYLDANVPPPVNPDALPDGVTYRDRGLLHLLSFDPALFQPRVVSAPLGRSLSVLELVKSVSGVAGVNGGYFDPASSLPVDLVAVGGLMTAGSLEKRATVGFTAGGQALFGFPRPRYVLSGPFGSVTVNSVRATPNTTLLTAFVCDGKTSVGGTGLTTLLLAPGSASVSRAVTGPIIAPARTLAFTFDPARFPSLPRAAGAPLTVTLNWQATDAPWNSAVDALSAGPLLVQAGRVVIDPRREGFNTATGVWRPTRQSALGTFDGQPTIAYFDYGTPEAFAAALAAAGVRDAVRMDSGSSATAYLRGGYGGLGAYMNTVWSRPVPNAIVFVPRTVTGKK